MAKNGVRVLRKGTLTKRLRVLTIENEAGINRIHFQGAKAIREEAKSSMATSPPTGRVYGDHIASSAGNPPRIDTAELVHAVEVKESPVRVGVFADSGQGDKAVWLEFGTAKIEPRPFMAPAVEKKLDEITLNVLKFLRRKAKEAGV